MRIESIRLSKSQKARLEGVGVHMVLVRQAAGHIDDPPGDIYRITFPKGSRVAIEPSPPSRRFGLIDIPVDELWYRFRWVPWLDNTPARMTGLCLREKTVAVTARRKPVGPLVMDEGVAAKDRQVGLHLSQELWDRLEAHVERVKRTAPEGSRVNKHSVTTALLAHALEEAEQKAAAA